MAADLPHRLMLLFGVLMVLVGLSLLPMLGSVRYEGYGASGIGTPALTTVLAAVLLIAGGIALAFVGIAH